MGLSAPKPGSIFLNMPFLLVGGDGGAFNHTKSLFPRQVEGLLRLEKEGLFSNAHPLKKRDFPPSFSKKGLGDDFLIDWTGLIACSEIAWDMILYEKI